MSKKNADFVAILEKWYYYLHKYFDCDLLTPNVWTIRMKRFSSSKDTGAPCQRCTILRIFLGLVLFVVILGLAGGEELTYLQSITTQKVANLIMVTGGLVFCAKLLFWYWDKRNSNKT